MADFIAVTGFNRHNNPSPSPRAPLHHLRSFSTTNTPRHSPLPSRPVSKSISTGAVPTMATVSSAPGIPTPRNFHSYDDDDENMSTLHDPRSRSMTPANEGSPTSPAQHPDLSNEIATLSNKLINAINYQTNLDDTLSATRQELESSRIRVKQLERETQEHADLIARGVLIKSAIAETEKNALLATLADERKLRAVVEKEKKNIEQELETLTTALFEEANNMVITARASAQKEQELIQRKNDQLKAQLADTESLLKSHQDQLAELKQVMEQLTDERDDQTNQTAPSTPGLSKFDSKDDLRDSNTLHPMSSSEPLTPSYPTSFTHLLHTVLRTDLSAYDDFTALLKMSKNVVGSRVSSGSYSSMGLGLGLGAYSAPSNGSTSSLATAGTIGSTPGTPTTPASSTSAKSGNEPNSLTPLSKTEFYKRALAEDIEPTLRLDTAPGLSWLARRNVHNAICDGTLVVEPVPVSTKPYSFPCSLCGEVRKDAAHVRSHRFKTSDNDSAQKYPLCIYCLGRVRSTCDFLGFLRILKDGHWRADDVESQKAAWEESIKLREQMFWSRVGGGVVPVITHHFADSFSKSPRVSEDERKVEKNKLSAELERSGELKPRDITPFMLPKHSKVLEGPAAAVGQTASEEAVAPAPVELQSEQVVLEEAIVDDSSAEIDPKKESINRLSTLSTASLEPPPVEKAEPKRLSITIPGSFD